MRGVRRFFSREKQVFLAVFSLTYPRFPRKSKNRLNNCLLLLKLVSAIFYQIFIFSPKDSPLKTMKNVLFHLKSSFHSGDIGFFVIFSLPFRTFQIQKGK